MRLLVLGGTGWLGGHVAAQALASGHDVTCVSRRSAAAAGAHVVHADRDRDDALTEVAAGRWDAAVDVATGPGQVRRAVRDLGEAVAKYVYVSSVSAYASQHESDADESAALFEPLEADELASVADYGAAKSACEQAVRTGFPGRRHAIVRPGLIGGPGDRSGRTGYWPRRFAHPSNPAGEVLVPDAPQLPTSVIDVRDLAAFLLTLAVGDAHGAFNAVGEPVAFFDHLAAAREAAGHTGAVVLAGQQWLRAHEVDEWAGPRSLPLWLADPEMYGMNTRSNARARAAGLVLRPLAETLTDALADALSADGDLARGAGLTDAEERELLAELAHGRPAPRR